MAHDVIVVGGGLVGSAVGWGLARSGLSVAVLDEGDDAFRASRGNFGLVWVQGKGDGMPEYAGWTRRSADRWPEFAETISATLGRDIGYRKPGGIDLCVDEDELAERDAKLRRMHNQAGAAGYDARPLDRQEVGELEPAVGPAVLGGTWCPHDGHVNPLYLLSGLHAGLAIAGAAYLPGRRVDRVEPLGRGFAVSAGGERLVAERVVLACGLGLPALAAPLGLSVPTEPERGQILVTERAAPFIRHPMGRVRQTEEGTVMIGASNQRVGFDTTASAPLAGRLAARAIRCFPQIAGLQLVRTWAALRIMSPDGFPIYEESERHPGAFAVTCHSGVTLAAAHALELAPAIANGTFRETFAPFSSRRFDVQTTRRRH